MLEQRRLQKLGQSTLLVSLPKVWVDQMNLKRGDTVNITTDEHGRLVIHPSPTVMPTKSKCVINVDKVDNNLLGRLILGAYIAGHETIDLRAARSGFTGEQLEITRNALTELIGVGIVDQGMKRIVIQSFLDPSKFPIDGLISRLKLIVESMVDLAVKALTEEKDAYAEQVIDMDVEADKVYFLATRQLLQAVDDKSLAEKVGLKTGKNIVGDRLILKALEEIGDYAQVIARSAMRINALGYFNKSIGEEITRLREHARKIGEQAMKSLSSGDPQSANAAIIEYELLDIEEERAGVEIENKLGQGAAPIATELNAMTHSLKQIGRYYMIAAETMINRAVESSTEISLVTRGLEDAAAPPNP